MRRTRYNPYMEMRTMNEASWDRVARAGIGVLLAGAALTSLTGIWQIVALAVGGILLVTGLVGWCPIYATFRTGTRNKQDQLAT
jgi:Inner membrane protein YgaP-like, transmembrane domain